MTDMRIIVSTKWFPKFIKNAIKENFETFFIDGKTDTIILSKKDGRIDETIGVTSDFKDETFEANFNHVQWYKIAKFIKKLPEQPIVIELNEKDEENISIVLCQFIQKF